MRKMIKFSTFAAAAAFASAAIAADKNIVDTAASAGNFKTLVKAVQEAGLADTLKGQGPFTVFAPTDEAFAKLPPGKLDALLKDREQLKKVLTYHVVPQKVMASEVKSGQVATVAGKSATIKADASSVKIDNAKVMKTDILASNGVIHVIDSVILPN